jgi:hypothetical protein
VHAYAKYGGTDTARMYDTPGDDTMIAKPDWTKLYSNDPADPYFVRAKHFEHVHGHSTAGGTDTAYLYDSPGNDRFVSDGALSQMLGDEYSLGAEGFEQVHAYHLAGGDDTAEVHDAVLEHGLTNQPVPSDIAYIAWLYHFDEVELKRDEAQGGDTTVEAVDEVFTAYWD